MGEDTILASGGVRLVPPEMSTYFPALQYTMVWFCEKIYAIRKVAIHGGFTEVFLVARDHWLPRTEKRRSP